jgi:hypothetical protein
MKRVRRVRAVVVGSVVKCADRIAVLDTKKAVVTIAVAKSIRRMKPTRIVITTQAVIAAVIVIVITASHVTV